MQQGGTLGKMFPERPLRVNDLLKKRQDCVWYQYEISTADNRIVWTFQFGTTGRKKLKHPSTIGQKQWKA